MQMDKISLVKYIMKKISDDNITAYAAQVTLFIIMSAVPFLLVFLALIRFTPISEDMILKAVEFVIPDRASDFVANIVDEVYNVGRVLIFSLIFAVYSSAKCIHSLRNGLNRVFEVKETRNWFILRARAMLETLAMIAVIILVLLLLVFGNKIQIIVRDYFPNMISLTDFLIKGRFIILFVLLILLFTFIYKVIPNRPATWKSQLVGAIGCAMSWYVFAFFLSLAIKYLNGFSLYGSITTLVIIMFWLDISMIIFFVCGEVNNAFEMIMAVIQTERAKKKEADAAKGKGKKVPVETNRIRLQQRAIALERKRKLDEKIEAGEYADSAKKKSTRASGAASGQPKSADREAKAAQKADPVQEAMEAPGPGVLPEADGSTATAASDSKIPAYEGVSDSGFYDDPEPEETSSQSGEKRPAKGFAASVFGKSKGSFRSMKRRRK